MAVCRYMVTCPKWPECRHEGFAARDTLLPGSQGASPGVFPSVHRVSGHTETGCIPHHGHGVLGTASTHLPPLRRLRHGVGPMLTGANRCAQCCQVAACPWPEPPAGPRPRTEEGPADAALLWIHVHLRGPRPSLTCRTCSRPDPHLTPRLAEPAAQCPAEGGTDRSIPGLAAGRRRRPSRACSGRGGGGALPPAHLDHVLHTVVLPGLTRLNSEGARLNP